uniref:Protein amnionless n=1 Tax=Arion vulgaris TaxID=1028688 RepID=A0A0B7AXU5_9EUPU
MKIVHSLCVIYVLVLLFGSANSIYKRWLRDTNFDNPNNWNTKRTPCGNDVTIIPDDSPVVYVQLNTTIKELVLPRNGELILGPNFQLIFSETPVEGCEDAGGDVEFTAVHPESWLNPDNWCSAPTERGACDVKRLLDVDKVPCNYDDVIFPRDHSYFIDLSEDTPILSAKTVKISGTTFTTFSLKNFFNSSEGRRIFRLPATGTRRNRINITRRACDDARGCACGNDRAEIAKVICSHAEKSCTRARCSQTIQPVGSCCKMCGAVFNITRGYGFNFNSFTADLTSKLNDAAYSGVNLTSSVTGEGWVQVVLTDLTGKKSALFAKFLLQEFNKDLASGGHEYAIDGVQLSLATNQVEPSHSEHTGVAMSGGSIAGIVFGVLFIIIIIAVVVVLVIFRRTGRKIPVPNMHNFQLPSMPVFPSFPRRGHRATARVIPGVFSQPHTASHIDPGFANPLYDSSPFDDGNTTMKEMDVFSGSIEEQPTFDISEGGFQNPLFGTSGASVFADPSDVQQQPDDSVSGRKGVTVISSGRTSDPTASIHIYNSSSPNGDSTI